MLRANFLSHDPASQACYSMQPFQVAHQDTLEGDLPRRIRTLPTSIQVRMRSGFPGHQYLAQPDFDSFVFHSRCSIDSRFLPSMHVRMNLY